ncbi:MAG: D-alanyl-D-alanine carboxypeptidase [Actinomycetota bacterium]|nr:D-alanyl-D-alanine carboxypeptidase [Actinomycetota bacterium]
MALAAVLGLLLLPAAAQGSAPKLPNDLVAGSWILVEESSGVVLASHEADRPLPIASATKLMTAYLAMRKLDPDERITAAPYDPRPGESLMGLEPGEEVTARELFYGLLVASGNDAATTLAIRVSGSMPGFVERMNQQARRLGLDDTSYADPIGLDEGNVSSARDLVALATTLRDDELFREIVDTPRLTVKLAGGPERLVNRNTLVLREPFVDGVKTGTTVAAGFVLVASAAKHDARFVSAVLGAPSESERDEATLDLLRYGAALYRPRVLVRVGEVVATLALGNGRGRLPLVAGESVKGAALPDQRVRVELDAPAPPDDAIARGLRLGTAAVIVAGEEVGQVDVLAARSAPAVPDRGGDGLPSWGWGVLAAAGLLAAGLVARAVAISRR